MAILNINQLVDVTVEVSPVSAARRTFDEALIIGDTDLIEIAERLRQYTSIDDMLTDGFATDDPEYLAAQVFFAQSPAPTSVWIGRQDKTLGTPESCLDAVTACRAKSSAWYACFVCGAAKADHIAVAAYIESCSPSTVYFYNTSDAEVLAGTEDNVLDSLQEANYSRSIGQYSTESAYAACAIMGYAMGQNSGLANSAYTLKFKQEVGITAEDISQSQVTALEAFNGNVYVNYGDAYDMFEQGVMANGQFFDEIINLDMLTNNIQLNVMDLLYQNPKIPQTDDGVTQIMRAVNQACEDAANIGFLGPGTWTGVKILNLSTGDVLPNGYLVQAEAVSTMSDADRQLRKAPPIYVAIKEAGAVHSVLIGVYVNR